MSKKRDKKKGPDEGAASIAEAAPASSTSEPRVAGTAAPAPAASEGSGGAALNLWFRAYRAEVLIFVACFIALASFSSVRFLRQSAAPHFVYQSQGWLEGRLDLDPRVLPNLEDWACVRETPAGKVRCEGQVYPTDKWYVSFPPFPALVMMPFVALHGYQFNDTSFGVIVGALALALFYSLLRFLRSVGETDRDGSENLLTALVLGFGTLFFYCAIRGEVWFSAEVMGVGFTALYLRNSIRARRPVLAGLFFSMATLTRTPLLFSGLFFVLEALCPEPGNRIEQLKRVAKDWKPAARKIGLFAAGAAPLGLLAAAYNQMRFGKLSEFGHKFLYNNRVNVDIDQNGLFDLAYLGRNLKSAFFMFPKVSFSPFRIDYDPNGLSLLLTLPLLVLLLVPKKKPRLHWPLWLTVAICALPGLFYQNNGYMQFGFRFSLDYTPYLMLLFAVGGWSFKNRFVQSLAAVGILVNFWGAIAFRGYTEYVRGW